MMPPQCSTPRYQQERLCLSAGNNSLARIRGGRRRAGSSVSFSRWDCFWSPHRRSFSLRRFAGLSRAGSAGSEDLRGMALDPAGNSVIVGSLNPGSPTRFGTITVNLAVSSIGGYFAKYDSSGNAIWVGTVQGTLVAGTHRVALDATGNVYVLGPFAGIMTTGQFTFQSSVNARDVYIAKLDPDGNVLWARAFGGPLNETTNPSATAGMASLALSGTNLFSTFDFGGSLQIDLGGGNFQVLSSQGGQTLLPTGEQHQLVG